MLWFKYLDATTKTAFQELIAEDHQKAWGLFKKDWYGVDQVYNHTHHEGLFWQVIHKELNPPSYLPFIKENALHQQYDYIRKFYGEYDPYWFEERKYPYLNESTMSRIVDDTVKATLLIVEKLKHIAIENLRSSSEILPMGLMLPYEMPLGDI